MKSILGLTVKSLLQTPEQSFWCDFVVLLSDGRYIQINEYDLCSFTGSIDSLISADLCLEEYSAPSLEGRKITALSNSEGDFGLILDDELFFGCEGAPGGNVAFVFPERNTNRHNETEQVAASDR